MPVQERSTSTVRTPTASTGCGGRQRLRGKASRNDGVHIATIGLLALLSLSACSTPQFGPAYVGLGASEPVMTDLDSAPPALLAQSAYIDRANLYLSLQDGGGERFGVVRRRGQQSATAPVRDMEPLAPEHWASQTASGVQVFGPAQWQQILQTVRVGITPTDRRRGAVVNVLDQQDLFHFYDEFGTLRTVPLVFKPEGVRVERTYRLDEVVVDAMPMVRTMLSPPDAPLDYALVNTGDSAAGGFPFVFLDFRQQHAVFVRSVPANDASEQQVPLTTTMEAATHLTTSHLRVVVEQPVTALTRLLTLAARTGTTLMDPRGRLPLTPGEIPPLGNSPGMDLAQWESHLDQLTGSPASRGHITTLIDGEAFFPRLIDTISAATQSLRLRTYIFDNDDYAVTFADLLKRRSAEIDVRVMVDGLGTIGAAAAPPANPPPGASGTGSMIHYLQQQSDIRLRVLSNPWLTGDHTKSIIVDDRVAFIGGMNIGREYRYEWHDLMVELSGPVVDVLRTEFDKTWVRQRPLGDLRAFFKRVKPLNEASADMYPVRVLTTSPRNTQILKAQIDAIRASRQRIFIQNAYFTSDAVLYELVMARRRGVDVRVILPVRSDFGVIDRANAIAANKMIANGIRVYLYPKMSHVKGAVYDGWACFGSANFDALSLQVNRELNIATSHAPVVEDLVQRVFLADMAASVELTEPFPSQWLDFLTDLLADVL